MTIFDFVLLFIWAGFLFYGFFFGLVRTLGSLLGVIIGAWLAGIFYLDFYNLIDSWFFGMNNLGKIACFIILFLIITKLVGIVVIIADQTFHLLTIIPFLKTINKVTGAALGFIEGIVVLGLILYGMAVFASYSGIVGSWLVNSRVAPFLINIISKMIPYVGSMI